MKSLVLNKFSQKYFLILLQFSSRLLSFYLELSQLLLSLATTVAMADLMAAMEAMEDPMVDMDMVKGRLRLPLMPSLAMEAMDTAAMEDLMVAMEAMADPLGDMATESKVLSSSTSLVFSNPTFVFILLKLSHVSLQNY